MTGGRLVPGHVSEQGASAAAAPAHSGGLGASVGPRRKCRRIPRVSGVDGRARLAVADEGQRPPGDAHHLQIECDSILLDSGFLMGEAHVHGRAKPQVPDNAFK